MKNVNIITVCMLIMLVFGGFVIIPDSVKGQHHTMDRLFYKNASDDDTTTSPYCVFDLSNFTGSQWPAGNIDISSGDTLDLKLKGKTYCQNLNNYVDDDDEENNHFKTLVQSEFIWSCKGGSQGASTSQGVTILNTDNPRSGYFLESVNEYTYTNLIEGDWVNLYWEININAYDGENGCRLMASNVTSINIKIYID